MNELDLKALGATPQQILWLFLSEAAMLSTGVAEEQAA